MINRKDRGSMSMKTLIRIWLRRREAIIHPMNPVQTSRYCAASSDHTTGRFNSRETTPVTTQISSANNNATAARRIIRSRATAS
jgi:hypothetical protein